MRKACSFFNSPNGCRNGNSCRFGHASVNINELPVVLSEMIEAYKDTRIDITWPMKRTKEITRDVEMVIKEILILDNNESGRYFDLDIERQEIIKANALTHGFTLFGACSLRRQFIRAITRNNSDTFFGERNMGSDTAAKEHANNFESALAMYLTEQNIQFLDENILYDMCCSNTPDFLLLGDIRINGASVRWIDCKTYYGSSELCNNPILPIGKMRHQITRYNNMYGPGAIVFLNGFSSDLNEVSNITNTLFLDSGPLIFDFTEAM